jgi:hypothetical protein
MDVSPILNRRDGILNRFPTWLSRWFQILGSRSRARRRLMKKRSIFKIFEHFEEDDNTAVGRLTGF